MNDYGDVRPFPFSMHITFAMALRTLVSIVSRYGEDHLGSLDPENPNMGCAYVAEVDGFRLVPSCILGVAFSDWGVLRLLMTRNGGFGHSVIDGEGCSLANKGALTSQVRRELGELGITFDDEAFTLLNAAQVAQDANEPWGQAVETAAVKVEQGRGLFNTQTAVERLTATL